MHTKIPNVVRRGGVYHFRRAIPPRLQPRLQRFELTCSLHTPDPKMARVRSRQLYLASERLFTQLDSQPMLTHEQVVRIAHEFYRTYLDEVDKTRLHQGAIKESQREALAAIHDKRAERVRMDLGLNDTLFARESTDHILRKLQLTGLTDKDREQARHAVMRAGLDAFQAVAAMYRGDFNYEPKDALLKQTLAAPPALQPLSYVTPERAAASTPIADQSPIFEEAARSFAEQQKITKRWDVQTAHQSRKSYELFSAIAGNKPLADYVKADAAHFKDLLERLPADYGKTAAFRGMTPQDILSHDAKRSERVERLSVRTVKRHITALSTLWADAISRGTVTTNIFSGFRFTQQTRAQDQRDMWETAELVRLFATPVWTGCASPHRRSTEGPRIIRDARFWLPLIAVFSALREEEICQLHVSDIKCDQGIWYFDINEDPPRKLKNKPSIRLVPVHSELQRIGFLAHVEAQRKRKETRLFPELKPGGADQRLGHGFSKWFKDYRENTNMYRKGLDFHSFRHSATTLMHTAGVEDSILDRVTGHATPGETARYTKGSDLRQLQQAIETIAPEVNFAKLYIEGSKL